jgi:hypothetical protein
MSYQVTIAGVIESDLLLTYGADGTPHCTFIVLASAQPVLVLVSNQHALWLASGVSAGALVQVDGWLRYDGQARLVQAVQVAVN